MKISMKLVYQYVVIFFNFPPTLNHFHSLQVENCDSNWRLVLDEDDNGKFRVERVNPLNLAGLKCFYIIHQECKGFFFNLISS